MLKFESYFTRMILLPANFPPLLRIRSAMFGYFYPDVIAEFELAHLSHYAPMHIVFTIFR